MRILFGLVACSCLALTPSALASQHGKPTTGVAHPTTPANPATAAAHPTPVALPQKIAANEALVARLQPLLPTGLTLDKAATGFKNEGQFIAALHVSHNLNIPFAQLKAEMTGSDHDSLGRAIHELRPTANAKAAVKTAEQQAKADITASKPSDTDKDDR